MSQLASSLSERSKNTLPNQPLTNPWTSSQAYLAGDQQLNQCNIVHTLKRDKKVENQVSMPPNPIQHKHPLILVPLHQNLTSLKKTSQPIRCTSL